MPPGEVWQRIEKVSAEGVAEFYTAWAEVLAINPGAVKTNAEFRDAYLRSAAIVISPEVKGKYPGLAEDIDAVIAETIGLNPGDELKSKELSETMRLLGNCLL